MLPLFCQSARLLDDAEAGGHIDHWAAVLGDGLSGQVLRGLIEAATPGCEIVPPHAASTGALMAAGEPLAFALLQADRSGGQPASGLLCVVQVSPDDRGQPTIREIRAAYPHLGAAVPVTARVAGIALFPGRLEARIRLDIGGALALDAFDTFYWRNRGRYRKNEPAEFALAALAYQMGPVASDDLVIDDPEQVRRIRARNAWAETHGVWRRADEAAALAAWRPRSEADLAAIRIDARTLSALMPLPEALPDDMGFQGEVIAVTPDAVTVLGERLWRVDIRVAGLAGGLDLVLPVHVSAAGFAGDWRPDAGDVVSGSLWLQTRLVEEPGEG